MMADDAGMVFGDTDAFAEPMVYVQTDQAKKTPFNGVVNRQPKSRTRNGVEFAPLMEVHMAQAIIPNPNEGNDKIIVALRPGKPATSREVVHVDDDGAGGWIIELA